jgi:hypothetical protein
MRPNDGLLIGTPTSVEVSFTAQTFSGDSHHHDKPSSRAACHYGVDGDALRGHAVPRPNRTCCRGAGAGWRGRSRRKAQTAAQGRAEGRAEGRAAERRTAACCSACRCPAASRASRCGACAQTRDAPATGSSATAAPDPAGRAGAPRHAPCCSTSSSHAADTARRDTRSKAARDAECRAGRSTARARARAASGCAWHGNAAERRQDNTDTGDTNAAGTGDSRCDAKRHARTGGGTCRSAARARA